MLAEGLAPGSTGRDQCGAAVLEGVARHEAAPGMSSRRAWKHFQGFGDVRETPGHPGSEATAHSGADELAEPGLGWLRGDLEQGAIGCDGGLQSGVMARRVPGAVRPQVVGTTVDRHVALQPVIPARIDAGGAPNRPRWSARCRRHRPSRPGPVGYYEHDKVRPSDCMADGNLLAPLLRSVTDHGLTDGRLAVHP